jgi:Zn finger protein HypA/HybF involved in hydrogenase expression
VSDPLFSPRLARFACNPVKVLPVRHHCRNCGADFNGTSSDVPCPECGHPHTEPVGGEEIRVMEIQVDDNVA